MAISVAFVDDHSILLEGLISLYSSKNDLNVVGCGGNAIDALRIAEELGPDVMVLDLTMPGDTIAAVDIITQNYPQIRILVFTADLSIETAVQVLGHGVAGYVLKGSTASELHEAISSVYVGKTFITPGFATKVFMSMKTDDIKRKARLKSHLSEREEQIACHLLRGSTNRQIAASLDISEKTVKHYMSTLMQKLAVRNRVEAVLAAQKLNLLPALASAEIVVGKLN